MPLLLAALVGDLVWLRPQAQGQGVRTSAADSRPRSQLPKPAASLLRSSFPDQRVLQAPQPPVPAFLWGCLAMGYRLKGPLVGVCSWAFLWKMA